MASIGDRRNEYKILMGKPLQKWLSGGSKKAQEGNINKDFAEII